MRIFVTVCISGAVLGLLMGCGPSEAGWSQTAKEQLAEPRAALLDKAEAAREALFTRLKGRLVEAIGAEGPAGAIGVCSEEAPEIARAVSEEFGVTIGRTSFKTRNPENVPPDWAKPYVAQRVEQPVYLEDAGTGQIAALLPIRLQPECVLCHGPMEAIPADVKAKIAERYPEDEATGFNVGDLRGWFHIVVPAS